MTGVVLIWAAPVAAAPVADATWSTTPGSGDFNTATNWTSGFVPTGTAFFGPSTITSLLFTANTTLGGFTFNPGAFAYSFSNSQVLDFTSAGIVINGGSATITNSNAINFLNASTAGGATITNNSAGSTSFGVFRGADTASAGTANITNNSRGSTYFFAHTTAGSATLTNNYNGSTYVFDASSAGSAAITNNSGGGIQFGAVSGTDTATAGSAQITNNGGGSTFFYAHATAGNATITNSGNTSFFDSSTAGSATITNNSGGVTTFFQTSTAGSAAITNNSGGGTQFGRSGGTDTSSAGSAVITNNGGVTVFNATTTAGSAAITNSNYGSTQFNATSTAGSAVITNNSGSTLFNNTSTAGSAAITNNNNGSTQFNATSSAGSAAITNNGGGNIYFYATSTAGNATIANNSGGLTQFLNASTAGNAAITNDNGSILFNGTSTAGSATITNNSGIVAFFGQSDGGAAHLINGAGGTIDFSGSSGPNGDDRLSVGSLAGAGTFIVGQQQLVTVSGSLAFTSGALYMVQVSGSNAGQIAVNGTATLNGNVEVDVLSRLTQKTTYTIFSSANPLSGTFNSVSLDNNFARDPVLTYVGDTVLLTLLPGLLSPLLPANAPANQVKVAGAIDNALLAGNNPTNAFNAIFNASGNALLNGLTQASGETATGSQQTTFNAMGQFMGLLTDPFMGHGGGINGATSAPGYADEEGASAYAAQKRLGAERTAYAMFAKAPLAKVYEPRWSVWASGFGGSQTTDGNATLGSNNSSSSLAGTAVGADYHFSPSTIAGFALAGGGTSFSVANGGSGHSDLFQAGAFIRHTVGQAYITGALAYGWQDITTNRTVTIAGIDQLRAEFNANAYSGRVEGGYRYVAPWVGGVGITPYAAGQFTTFDLPAYAESVVTGTPAFALNYAAKSVTDVRSELGIRTDKSFAVTNGVLTLRGRFAWAHDFDPDRNIAATFQALPGASFVVGGAGQASDSALTTASAEMKWMNGWSAAATFEGEFSNVTRSYAGKGAVRYAW
ncbi:hypothetical protein UP10_28820 [Bradyrhizobium sp. LTSPM299]|nr:hypothetical protein UP10_28820 [Bradyrhizobium sp. LTSPM299]